MSDSEDDWENQLDSDNEDEKAKKQAEDEAKKKIAALEDAVDSRTVEKEKKEQQKKQQQEEQEKRQKENAENAGPKKKNYDQLFDERNKKNAGVNKVDTSKMTEKEKGIAMQMAQEDIMTQDLLGDDENALGVQKVVKLNSEEDYRNFGKQTAEILYKGSCPYRIEAFASELFKELPEHCNAKQINEIVRRLQTMYNQKQKEEKSKDKNVKKDKPQLKYGGQSDKYGGYERNNNSAMVNDVMGANAGGGGDDDEYGDYGDEQNFRKENEADYDFM